MSHQLQDPAGSGKAMLGQVPHGLKGPLSLLDMPSPSCGSGASASKAAQLQVLQFRMRQPAGPQAAFEGRKKGVNYQ